MIRLGAVLCLFIGSILSFANAEKQSTVPPAFSLDHLPLIFEPNRGQAPSAVEFLSRGSYSIFLQSDRAVFGFPPRSVAKNTSASAVAAVTLQLVASNRKALAQGLELLPGTSNYYIGTQSSQWRTGVAQYAKVFFKSVYSGIDLVYYGDRGQLEYDFLIAPGANPGSLHFRITGTDKVELDSGGNLVLRCSDNSLELHKPTIYQREPDGSRRLVAGEFALHGNEIRFRIGKYDSRKQLIIDPVLTYSTLIGANNSTQVQGIAVDGNGDLYITGTTFATNYPTLNAFQAKNNGTTNVFITKLGVNGNAILYSTYIGSSGFDNAAGIAVDRSGDAYVTGTVGASNFPTTPGAFMTTCPGICNTPFLSKFATNGTLVFSSFMGGSNSPAHAIAVDGQGEAYIAGDTASNDMPTTPGSFEPTFAGQICTSCFNAYVEKLNASGTDLVYSTYFGLAGPFSTPSTSGTGLAVDSSGNAYLVGTSGSIPLKNPIQITPVGAPDTFVAKFSPDGSALMYSTFIGGDSPFFFGEAGNFATGVAVDPFGNAHVTGTSSSCDFPLTLNAFSTDCVTLGYDQKIFVLTLNSAGNQLLFSTFLRSGNSPGIAVDSKGDSYIAGSTTANNFPVLNPIESTSQRSNSSGFIIELDPSGKILFSTYLGATGEGSQPSGIAVDGKGGIYVAGSGQGDFPILNPIPSQTFQSTFYTIFAAKISSASSAPQLSLSPRASPILALRNVSSGPLTVDSIVPSSNFTVGGNCGANLAAGTGCNLILEGAADNKTTGTVTITSSASVNPIQFTIHKSPTGDSVGSIVSIFPTSLQFPPQLIGTQSAQKKVLIQNLGLQPAAINSISMIQPSVFRETNNCPALLNPTAFCIISITYSSTTAQDSAQLAIVHDPNQTRDTIFLSGTGSSSAIATSTTAVQFGTQFAGTAGVGRIVNLQNNTPYPATITGISVSSGFAQSNTCTSALATQASCRVLVTFVPTGNVNASGTLTASNFGPGGAQTINLFGTGMAPGAFTVSPVALSFPGTYVGIGSSSQPVTLTNVSQNPVPITSISVGAPFTQTNNCSMSLGPEASCQISVSFQPKQPGTATGKLQIAFSGSGSPQVVGLSGTAQTIVQFNPSLVQFGNQVVNVAEQTYVSIANYGSTTVTLGSLTVQGSDFSLVSNGCGTTLPRNSGCGAIQLGFKPSATGLRTGTLSVNVSNSSTPLTAVLEGTGISNGAGNLSAASLSFGLQAVGTSSQAKTATFKNTGSGKLTLSSISVSPTLFGQTNTCGSSLLAGASCSISVTFSPTLKGMLVGSLTVQDDGANSPHTIALSGTGN